MDSFDNKTHKDVYERKLLIVPTIDVVIFPKMVVPLLVVDKNVIQTLMSVKPENENILLVAAKESSTAQIGRAIGREDLHNVGTLGRIIRSVVLPDENLKILVQGVERATICDLEVGQHGLMAKCQPFPFLSSDEQNTEMLQDFLKRILALTEKNTQACRSLGSDFQFVISQLKDPERLVDFLLTLMNVGVVDCQRLLEKNNIQELLEQTLQHFKAYVEKASIKEEVRSSARSSMNRNQREYFLREQLRAIKKELGEHEESEIDDFKKKIAELDMSTEAREESDRQIRRLEKTSTDSLEAAVIRNHLEWLLGMPWNQFIMSEVSIRKAKEVLDEDHFGLHLVKERILDYLSVKCFQEKYNAQVLCLVGPPGVGKTSIGRSIAKALGRRFARISLGGMHDESEIRGHRRTYVGALPGRIVQAIRKAGSCNPVLMIDEIDKLGSSGRGDPSSALLEVLDPEQNVNFYDNYLGVSFDLSSVMFIATCNDASSIPEALRDRMEIIQLAGYTRIEKMEITKRFLVPKIINNMGLGGKGLNFSPELISEIINSYTLEFGVRDVERFVGKICSKFARSLVEEGKALEFNAANISEYLGPKRNRLENLNTDHKVGVTNGLAWTTHGGQILQVEAVLMPGTGKLILTGQLGSVMKESAQAAVSYIRSKSKQYGIPDESFNQFDLHIHLPAGAIPKDGPSAGITLLSSMLSAYTNRPVDCRYAMTGELNLQGSVLPIGGLKEKILAAQQQGLKWVILPESNRQDVEGDKSLDLAGIELLYIKHVEELLPRILVT